MMMKQWETTVCLLAALLQLSILDGCAAANAACTIVNRFLGKDSGIVLPVALTYDVTVKAGTTRNVVNSTILPAIEKAFAAKSAPNLIVACAPAGKNTSRYSDIVGIDLDPRDSIVGACSSRIASCYTVHSEVILFTKSTNKGVSQTYLLVIATLMLNKTLVTGGVVNPAIVSLTNLKAATAKSSIIASPAASRRPTRRPTKQLTKLPTTQLTKLPTKQLTRRPTKRPTKRPTRRLPTPSRGTQPGAPPVFPVTSVPVSNTTAPAPKKRGTIVGEKIGALRRDNPKAFIGIIVGIVVVSLLSLSLCGFGSAKYATKRGLFGTKVVRVRR